MDFKTWHDLTEKKKLAFAIKVKTEMVRGWENIKKAARETGFEPTEDMPTLYELLNMAK